MPNGVVSTDEAFDFDERPFIFNLKAVVALFKSDLKTVWPPNLSVFRLFDLADVFQMENKLAQRRLFNTRNF